MTPYAIRTIRNKESEVCDDLKAEGLQADMYTCRQLVRQKGFRRHKEMSLPILPGYIFATIAPEQYQAIKDHKHVIAGGILPLNRSDVKDLARFADLVSRGHFNHDGLYGHLKPGQRMLLVGGIFEGLMLSFERVKDDRLRGMVETSMGFLRVEVDGRDAEVA